MMNFRVFKGKELQQEKQKDYRNVVMIQIFIIIFGLTLSEFMQEGPESNAAKLVTTVFSFFGMLYSFLLWDLVRNFTPSQLLIKAFLLFLFGIVIIGVLVEFPYYKVIEVPDRRVFLLFFHGIYFPIEIMVIAFVIRDVFTGEFLTPDKLWGSACVFLMIGISFGSLYHLICLARPGSLGVEIDPGFANYSDCVTYSLSILGGTDPGQPAAVKLIKNISVLEAVWGNLFVVLVIGKLMGLPRPPKADQRE